MTMASKICFSLKSELVAGRNKYKKESGFDVLWLGSCGKVLLLVKK